MFSCKVLVLKSGPAVQLSTTEGNSYYVGTKMDAFVYDTLNAWYQEDMGTVSTPCTSNDNVLFHYGKRSWDCVKGGH